MSHGAPGYENTINYVFSSTLKEDGMTAIAEKLHGSNIARQSRLYLAAQRALAGNVSHDIASRAFLLAIQNDAQLLRALIGDDGLAKLSKEFLERVARDMKSGGNTGVGQSAIDTQSTRADVNSSGDRGAGQETCDTQRKFARDNSSGQSTSDTQKGIAGSTAGAKAPAASMPRIIGFAAKAATAKSALDSFKIRDGRSIGDVKWCEIGRLIGMNTREAAVLRLIGKRYANVQNENAPIRDLIDSKTLERFIQEAAHVEDKG